MSASTTLQKRLYTVLPRGVTQAAAAASSSSRVRSNSASSSRSLYTAATPTGLTGGFFDAAPQPTPGRSQLAVSRLPIEGRGEVEGPPSPTHHQQSSNSSHGPAPPSSIALTSPPANNSSPFAAPSSGPFFPYPPFNPPPAPTAAAPLDAHAHPADVGKRAPRHKYYFDVGAYGIPKRSRTVVSGRDGHGGARSRQTDALDLAVNVGEDAYFVRENAMGVADGVGGWSRNLAPSLGPHDPSPSALFARRLMHFCSAELAQLSAPSLPQTTSLAFEAPPAPHVPFYPGPGFSSWHAPVTVTQTWAPFQRADDWTYDLAAVEEIPEEDPLEELEDGLDILHILERAYARTIEAHVAPAPPAPRPTSPMCNRPGTPPFLSHDYDQSQQQERKQATVPLMTGSSTALLAVLDSAGAGPHPAPAPEVGVAEDGCDAVLRVAHLGDCMGMLVRGDEIVWRSDEMWWSFNTPLQLGPASRTSPDAAQLLTLPARADDILILASDGLSDNLWDEDVLDEVIRFRRASISPPGVGAKVGRRALAGMLSEALCSRARKVSEARASRPSSPSSEIPFARRAREEGRSFAGGKTDDISVLVAVISPAEEMGGAGGAL
ncbi:hypothetical protein PENSPDRAFT_657624 [Peniophora sp. CONT]|nr:hypothetical protein PENSPDRAFT_657624 [Peniophora sp. CONT]